MGGGEIECRRVGPTPGSEHPFVVSGNMIHIISLVLPFASLVCCLPVQTVKASGDRLTDTTNSVFQGVKENGKFSLGIERQLRALLLLAMESQKWYHRAPYLLNRKIQKCPDIKG